MIRKIIRIDEQTCNGCSLCTAACHEGAIGMAHGKAKLLRDDYCDGLGDCLPVCPTGAITFEEREAAEYDEAAVKTRMKKAGDSLSAGGCPGTRAHIVRGARAVAAEPAFQQRESQLMQWPVQLQLVPVSAPYFEDTNLLICADCAAYAKADFHERFMKNHSTVIGCPKLDSPIPHKPGGGDYGEKLTAIFRQNNIRSVTVVRMEVPCCGGIERAAVTALQNSGKMIPWQVVTLSTDGHILER